VVEVDTNGAPPQLIGDYEPSFGKKKAKAWNEGRKPDAPDPLWRVYDDTGTQVQNLEP
jgi:hypothetical protein